MANAEYVGGFWHLFDKVTAPAPGRVLSLEDARRRTRVFEAARALARGDYGPARALLAEG